MEEHIKHENIERFIEKCLDGKNQLSVDENICVRAKIVILFLDFSSLNMFFGKQRIFSARSRLYRRRFLRPNTRWEALDEICKFHILLVTLIFKILQI